MILHTPRPKPGPLRHAVAEKPVWSRPFFAIEHIFHWAVHLLSNWAFLETLEYLGSLSVLVAVVFYFSESGNRAQQRHYQAWQVINTAQGKGGSGGRIDALQELNSDGVPLAGVDVEGAYLFGVRLQRADLVRANFHNGDVRKAVLDGANLSDSDLAGANFREGTLRGTELNGANLQDATLDHSDLSGADLTGCNLENTDLSEAELRNIRWGNLQSVKGANLFGVKDAPEAFVAWALQHGAVQTTPNGQ